MTRMCRQQERLLMRHSEMTEDFSSARAETEPLIRVMVEAETPEICEKYVDQVIDVLKKKMGHVTES